MPQQTSPLSHAPRRQWHRPRTDRGRGVAGAAVVLLVSSLVVAAYYVNHPAAEIFPDTQSYLTVSQRILTNGQFIDPGRTPGYPLLMALVFLLCGPGSLFALSVVQGVLFVASAVEAYGLAYLLTRRAGVALIVGLALGMNTYLISFVKPVLSEGVALWVVTTLTLAFVVFLRTLRVREFWLMVALLLVAMMTRAEWAFGPALIGGVTLVTAARHGRLRRLLPHVLSAMLALSGLLGLYVYGNATLNGFAGITAVERINLLGKLLQYHMEDEAPPQYASVAAGAHAFVQAGGRDPYNFGAAHPAVEADEWSLAGAYAASVVKSHPVEFALKTMQVVLTSSNTHYQLSVIDDHGRWGAELLAMQRISLLVVAIYPVFPIVAVLWLGLVGVPLSRRLPRPWSIPQVEMVGAVSLMGLYELVVVSAGGYSDYPRLHTPFDPIMFVVICASYWHALSFTVRRLLEAQEARLTVGLARWWPRISRGWAAPLAAVIVLSAVLTLARRGPAALENLDTWTGVTLATNHAIWFDTCLALTLSLIYLVRRAHRCQGGSPIQVRTLAALRQ